MSAEDVVQTALVAVWRQWTRSGPPDNPRAYAATVAIRLARRYAREEQGLRAEPVTSDLPDGRSANTIDAVTSRVDLERAVETLPARQRLVTRLYLAGKSTREIASLLAISPSTVAVHLSNARLRLRACLRESTGE